IQYKRFVVIHIYLILHLIIQIAVLRRSLSTPYTTLFRSRPRRERAGGPAHRGRREFDHSRAPPTRRRHLAHPRRRHGDGSRITHHASRISIELREFGHHRTTAPGHPRRPAVSGDAHRRRVAAAPPHATRHRAAAGHGRRDKGS